MGGWGWGCGGCCWGDGVHHAGVSVLSAMEGLKLVTTEFRTLIRRSLVEFSSPVRGPASRTPIASPLFGPGHGRPVSSSLGLPGSSIIRARPEILLRYPIRRALVAKLLIALRRDGRRVSSAGAEPARSPLRRTYGYYARRHGPCPVPRPSTLGLVRSGAALRVLLTISGGQGAAYASRPVANGGSIHKLAPSLGVHSAGVLAALSTIIASQSATSCRRLLSPYPGRLADGSFVPRNADHPDLQR